MSELSVAPDVHKYRRKGRSASGDDPQKLGMCQDVQAQGTCDGRVDLRWLWKNVAGERDSLLKYEVASKHLLSKFQRFANQSALSSDTCHVPVNHGLFHKNNTCQMILGYIPGPSKNTFRNIRYGLLNLLLPKTHNRYKSNPSLWF